MAGAVVLTVAGEWLRATFGAANLLIYGIAMVGAILCLPDGLVGLAGRPWRTRARTMDPTREGVADVR